MRETIIVTVEAPDENAGKITEAVSFALGYPENYPYDVDASEWDVTVASTPTVEQVFDRLWNAADDFESGVLMSLLITAGLIWECTASQDSGYACGTRNDESAETCEECGAPRPAREEREEG